MPALTLKKPAAPLPKRAEPAPALAPIAAPQRDLVGQVRVLTCGSVDDGKSTLIGRLLWDASDLFEDQRETLRRSTRRALDGKNLDYSLLVDGLLAEREQGITIDIAWRYFDTVDRRFTIIDSPGHTQYTRNMASGATHADVAIMLIDARHGIKPQTKRHAALLDLFGVRRVILAVNKMDLVDWSQARFDEIERDLKALVAKFRFDSVTAIPLAAVTGDNVARGSKDMPWYVGPTLLDQLNESQPAAERSQSSLRFPVQMVLRGGQDFRGLAGTVTSGSVSVGDELIDVVSGATANVARISTMDGDVASAGAGRAVTLLLDRDVDLSRGAVLARHDELPRLANQVDARLVWLAETPLDQRARYLLRTATDTVSVDAIDLSGLLDLDTLALQPATECTTNDIAAARFRLGRAIALDAFADLPGTGSFLLIDPTTGATVAGGIVVAASAVANDPGRGSGRKFRLTREQLSAAVCADVAADATGSAEFNRRAAGVVAILRAAGVDVDASDLS